MSKIPVFAYGGTERVIWDLAKSLVELGHEITFLVPHGSSCDFSKIQFIDPSLSWKSQIPKDADIVHFQFQPNEDLTGIPYVITEHGNALINQNLDKNTIFLSKDHAKRHGSEVYVYNGLDWRNYGEPELENTRNYYHFLGKVAWRVKNVKGAIKIANKAHVPLHILGGNRFNFKRGIRLTFSKNITFHGMVGGEQKLSLLKHSKGLIFPVRWHEPFGLAIIESMYFGCPIFSTPYGAIPELVPENCGFLSNYQESLICAVKECKFEPSHCHEHVKSNFSATVMANHYLKYYNQVKTGLTLNKTQPVMLLEADNLKWYV